MRLTAVSKVLDETDIIEAFVRHTAAFVSHQIILDNGSCDGTVEILKHLRTKGFTSHCCRTIAGSSTRRSSTPFSITSLSN